MTPSPCTRSLPCVSACFDLSVEVTLTYCLLWETQQAQRLGNYLTR